MRRMQPALRRNFRSALVFVVCLLAPLQAQAAIAYVQTATATGNGGATATTSSVTVTGGNTVFVVLGDQFSTSGFGYTHSCSDATNGTYTKFVDYASWGGSLEIWYKTNVAGGTYAVSCSQTGGGYIAIRVLEFSGLATSSVADQSSTQLAGGASFSSGSTSTTAQADELLIGAIAFSSTMTASGAAGWTDLGEIASSGTATLEVSYWIVSSTGNYAYTGTTDQGSSGVAIVTFKAAVGGGATCTGGMLMLGVGVC